MELAQTAWLEGYKRGGNGLGGRKVARVDDVKGASATGDLLRLMLESAVDEGCIAGEVPVVIGGDVLGSLGAVDDERGRPEVLEYRLIDAEVSGNDITRRMAKPVDDVEGRASGNRGQCRLPLGRAAQENSGSLTQHDRTRLMKKKKNPVSTWSACGG